MVRSVAVARTWHDRAVDPTDTAYGLAPLPGGHSGETFLAEAAGERTVVRVYGGRGARRGPSAPEVDAAVLRLVRGLLPVPEVLEVRRPDPDADAPGLLVTTFLPGERLEEVLPRLDDHELQVVGEHLGHALARLAHVPMLRNGTFADSDLRVEPFPAAEDLVTWVDAHATGTALEDWAPADLDALRDVADEAQRLLDRLDRVVLVHSDFNAKNLLVDPETLELTGVLDWEFAHAGSPLADLGNLLRFDRAPALVDAVTRTYLREAGGLDGLTDVAEVLELARAADLVALVELASRKGENPVADRAESLLLRVASSRNLSSHLPHA
jgi:aminoglycoside phosphotransferase (APT) family kinase protein